MSYQPVGAKRHYLFSLTEKIRIVIFKVWFGPKAMSKLLDSSVHPVMILEHFGATIEHPTFLRPSLQIINATNASNLKIFKGVHIGEATRLDLSNPITIGENSTIAQGTVLLTHQNVGRVNSLFAFVKMESALTIEPNVFIGVNSIVLATTETICEGSVIGAQSMVSKSITEPGVYVGNPMKKIR